MGKLARFGCTKGAAVVAALLAACGGGGDGNGGAGSGGPAALPATAAPTVQDTSKVGLGAAREDFTGESPLTVGPPEDVAYPYDPNDPDNPMPAATTLRLRSVCSTRTYDITSNPSEVILYAVDQNYTFPGALLRGDDFRAGRLARLGVRPEHRAPISYTISNVFTQAGKTTSGTVVNPDLVPVTDAVKATIVAAYNDNIPIADSVTASIEETSDVTRFMLKSKISARYGFVSGSLGTKISKQQSERTVIVHLTQKLFDVTVQQPPTRNDWFNTQFFANGLQPLLDSGEFSTINQPVYVARVTYGRVLSFTMTTTASKSDIDAMMSLSIKTLRAGGSVNLGAKNESISTRSKKTLAQIGGSGADALAAADTGDWGAFFRKNLALTQAVPIMVHYNNLYDNSPAGVTESTQATEEVCTPQIVVPGPFDFGLQDRHERPLGMDAIHQAAVADFDGDGATDVVWNELIRNTNRFYISYGNKSGRLRVEPHACGGDAPCNLGDGSVPWGQYRLLTGDFNGDGRGDLAWLSAGPLLDTIELRALPARADGTFDPTSQVVATFPVGAGGLAGLRADMIIKDLTNDNVGGTGRGRDDIVLWFVTRNAQSQNLVDYQVIRSVPAAGGGIAFEADARTRLGGFTDFFNSQPATARYSLHAVDLDSDGWRDLMLNALGQDLGSASPAAERNVVVRSMNQKVAGAASFGPTAAVVHSSLNGWNQYLPLVGDFDGDRDIDVAWVNHGDSYPSTSSGNVGAVHQMRFDASSQAFSSGTLQWWTQSRNPVFELLRDFNARIFTLEINGDAAQDVVVTRFLTPDGGTVPTLNAIAALKGIQGGNPVFNTAATAPQEHPVSHDWRNYTILLTGDFNGDRLQDVLWSNGALDNACYIAFSKREAEQATR